MAGIINPIRNDSIIAVTGENTKCKIIDVGTWDMLSSYYRDISHGLDRDAIRSIGGWIRDDVGTSRWNIPSGFPTGPADLSIGEIMSTFIRLYRLSGGIFDTAFFQSTAFNRGQIIVFFED